MNKTVYLAGPISICSYDEATAWRDKVTQELAKEDIKALSPLRGKVYLRDMTEIADSYSERDVEGVDGYDGPKCMSTARGITTRDRMDCMRCSVLFVNLLGTKRISIGTMMEIAWADAARIPIVMILEKEDNPHDHAMVNECIGYRTDSLDEGIAIVKHIFAGY